MMNLACKPKKEEDSPPPVRGAGALLKIGLTACQSLTETLVDHGSLIFSMDQGTLTHLASGLADDADGGSMLYPLRWGRDEAV
jgi:hypothetical protein